MSLSTQVQKITTFQSIQAEFNKTIASMQNTKAGFDYLTEQITAMQSGDVFTSDEVAEVQSMQDSIISIAKSLIPTE